MAVDVKGFSVFRSDWAGAVTVTIGATSATITPSASTSSSAVMSRIVSTCLSTFSGSTFSWAILPDGRYNLTNSDAFSVSFAGTTHTKLGYSVASLSGSNYYSASAVASDAFYLTNRVRYTLDVPQPQTTGVTYSDKSVLLRTPGTDWKSPELSMVLKRAEALDLVDKLAQAQTPGKISVVVGTEVTTHHLGRVTMRTRDSISGVFDASLEVLL